MRLLSMTLASIKMTLRNRQSLFWLLVFPIFMMGLFGIIFGNDQGEAKLSIVDLDKSSLAQSITEGLGKVGKVKLEEDSRAAGLDKLKKGKVDAVLVLEKGFSRGFPQRPAAIKLYYDPSSARSQMMNGTVSAVLSGIERSMIKAPPLITITSRSVQSDQFNYIDFLLPGILAMSLMNSGLYGVANATVSRREKGVLRRLKLTPMPLSQFIGAGIINQLIMSLMQAALLITVGRYAFGVKFVGGMVPLLITVVIGSLCFITIGFVIASFAKTAETAATLGNVIGMPMMFLGGVFFPVDNVPAWIKPVIQVLPLKYLADSLRGIMLQGQTLAAVQDNLLILLGLTAVLFLISVKFFRWESEKR